MKLSLNGQTFTPRPQELLGQGGEACVYRFNGEAVKLYHTKDDAELSTRGTKLDALAGRTWPAEVLAPRALLRDAKGRTRGFSMELLSGATDFRRLGQRKWRDGRLTSAQVMALFRQAARLLDALHGQGVVVGDLNDANLVFCGDRVRLIDADSLHLRSHPCTVAHERFLAPELYGVDLSRSAAFSARTDWYAFAVQLFASLLYVHPYGGVHPSSPTLLHRAQAGHSVLRGDVKTPRTALDPRVLPDVLHAWFDRTFEAGERSRPDPNWLKAPWRRCTCGVEYGGRACPACTTTVSTAPRGVSQQIVHGDCRAVRLFRGGPILAACMQGRLRYVYLDGDTLRREDGRAVGVAGLSPDAVIAIAGAVTWIGEGRTLTGYVDGQARFRHFCDVHQGQSAFAASPRGVVTLEGDWLVDRTTGRRLGTALGRQTRLFAGERIGYLFYRPGRLTVHALFRPDRPGLINAALPPFEGRLIDVDAQFSDSHVLVWALTEAGGARRAGLWLLDHRGQLVADRTGPADADPLLCAPRALAGGTVALAGPDGLVAMAADGGRLVPGRLFPDTRSFVGADMTLFPGPSGSLYTLNHREIHQISLS
ncbi:MAG: hypothetical protein H6739_24350 [Alphaproteobacteria bacterium]|nr:hypothetical protein [Alphaproteobacteria bacterium]